MMLHTKESPRIMAAKYLLLIPVLALALVSAQGAEAKSSTAQPVFTENIQADNGAVTGFVFDENGKAMPGVIVAVKGGQQGAVTGMNGDFSLNIPESQAVLVFSFVGHEPLELNVTTGKEIKVTLSPSNSTASIQNSTNAIRIRGIDPIGANRPLIILDWEIFHADMNTIDPNTIESITVLKDKKSTDLFGEKGKNGVIIINTKKGMKQAQEPPTDPSIDDLAYFKTSTPHSEITPLVLVDGKEIDHLRDISPQDIESISVLKDGSATALYGERAKGGVILVTLKK